MKKRALSLILVLALLLSMAACAPKAPATPAADAVTPEAAGTEELSGTITIWSWDVAAKSLQESADNFKKLHPKVEFVVEDLGTDQVYDKMTTGLASGIGLPDVVSIEGERIASYVSKFPKGFVDLTSEIKTEDFLPVKISECAVGGKLYAFPWDGAPVGLYYRTDLFEKAGIKAEDIKTWDDLIEAGKKMNTIGVKMIPFSVSKNNTIYLYILNQLGGNYFDKAGNTMLNSDASIQAMTMVKKMYDAEIVFDSVNWDGLVTCTKEGKVATVASAVWWAGTLQDECSEASGKWAVMNLPVVAEGGIPTAVNGGSNLMVPAASQNQKAAVAFVKFAMTDKGSLINGFSKYGLYPSYIPSYSDPIFDKEVPYFNNQKIWRLFADLGKQVPQLNLTENNQQTFDMVVNAQAKILLKGADVKATMDELQKNVVDKFGK